MARRRRAASDWFERELRRQEAAARAYQRIRARVLSGNYWTQISYEEGCRRARRRYTSRERLIRLKRIWRRRRVDHWTLAQSAAEEARLGLPISRARVATLYKQAVRVFERRR